MPRFIKREACLAEELMLERASSFAATYTLETSTRRLRLEQWGPRLMHTTLALPKSAHNSLVRLTCVCSSPSWLLLDAKCGRLRPGQSKKLLVGRLGRLGQRAKRAIQVAWFAT